MLCFSGTGGGPQCHLCRPGFPEEVEILASRASFVARWSPRIGRKAARLYVLTGPTTTLGFWSAPVWLILFLIGQGWSRVSAYVVAGIGLASLAFATVCLHLMYRALSQRFGFKISWRNAPPYRYKAFGAWCRSRGIEPTTGRPLEPGLGGPLLARPRRGSPRPASPRRGSHSHAHRARSRSGR